MSRHKWTALEHRCLVVMWENGVPIDQIAKALERTHEDVNNQLVHLRMMGVKISNKIRAMKKRQVIGEFPYERFGLADASTEYERTEETEKTRTQTSQKGDYEYS